MLINTHSINYLSFVNYTGWDVEVAEQGPPMVVKAMAVAVPVVVTG
jgi:hypothetical protein